MLFGVCFALNHDCFSESSPLGEHSHVLSRCVPFPKGSGGIFSPSASSSGHIGIGFGFLGDLKHGLHPTPTLFGWLQL